MQQSKSLSVAILYFGGDAGDLADTEESVKGIKEALETKGHEVTVMEVNEQNWKFALKLSGDVVFNLVEDPGFVLYQKVGKGLEHAGRAQVGHDLKVFDYITDKTYFKKRMKKAGIPTPPFVIFDENSDLNKKTKLNFPVIVKPCGEHAGIGISQNSVVENHTQLIKQVTYLLDTYGNKVLTEEFIKGREMHVTVMGNGKNVSALPICEIIYGGEYDSGWNIYSYQAKWEKESWEYKSAQVESPADLTKTTEHKLTELAKLVFSEFNCKDIARVDIRLDVNNQAYVVDINLSPSLNRYDDQDATLKSVEALGWKYEDFIEKVIALTYKRIYSEYSENILSI